MEALDNAAKEMIVTTALPAHQIIEARLRLRYEQLWTDIRRELDKHDEQHYSDLVQGSGDIEDDATASLLIDLNLEEIDRDVAEMRQVQTAIARLRRGEYGRCQRCDEEIPRERLEALPYAALCIECQRRNEHLRTATPSL